MTQLRVTFDSGALDNKPLLELAQSAGWDVCIVSTTARESEQSSSWASAASKHSSIPEIAVLDESRLDECVWADDEDDECFETALRIIGAGSFPPPGKRENLSAGQQHQLRDAQIFCTHVRDGRDLLVTTDGKGFIKGGRREALQESFKTRIRTPEECLAEFGEPVNRTPVIEAKKPVFEIPPDAIHLGTFEIKGPGQYVGGVLKLRNNPEEDLLSTANDFREAADRCLTGGKVVAGISTLTVPGAVCAAFACELYLKFIHLKESGKQVHGHDLLELFRSLGTPTKDALRLVRRDVEEVLDRNKSHFVDARYHHEVSQFSFRQQELLQLANALGDWVGARYGKGEAES